MQTNIFAYTEPVSPYPAFLSLNRLDDGRTVLTVRHRGHGGARISEIEVPHDQLMGLLAALKPLAPMSHEACPHAAPFVYCSTCVESPCPIGLSNQTKTAP